MQATPPRELQPGGAPNALLRTWPEAPRSVAEAGLPPSFLEELALKTIHYAGPATIDQLSRRMGLARSAVEELVDGLRAGGALETTGAMPAQATPYAVGATRFALSTLGEQRAAEALSRCRYGGTAPVTLTDYVPMVRTQSLRRQPADLGQIGKALAPFVLSTAVRTALARAFHSGRPALIYGESGNGKTAIIDAFTRGFGDAVLIPAALYVHGQLIRIYDPSVHVRVEPAAGAATPDGTPSQLKDDPGQLDRRWLPVRRPVVAVAGELRLEHLELKLDVSGGFYTAPPHIKAQDGVFVLDDFGRQQVRPDDLLNRWIPLLERGADLLTLANGEYLSMPFEASVLFSTNLPPSSLVDDAFLRRIPYKVCVAGPGRVELAEIARRECTRRRLAFDEAAIEALVSAVFRSGHPAPRGVCPRDLLGIVEDGARFNRTVPRLTAQAIEDACSVYFVSEGG